MNPLLTELKRYGIRTASDLIRAVHGPDRAGFSLKTELDSGDASYWPRVAGILATIEDDQWFDAVTNWRSNNVQPAPGNTVQIDCTKRHSI